MRVGNRPCKNSTPRQLVSHSRSSILNAPPPARPNDYAKSVGDWVESHLHDAAGKQQLHESPTCSLQVSSKDRTPLDHEQVRDLLDLNCAAIIEEPVDAIGFEEAMKDQLAALGEDAEGTAMPDSSSSRKSSSDTRELDHKATFDAKRKSANERRKPRQEALAKAANVSEGSNSNRKPGGGRKIDDAEDEYRTEQ